MQPSEFAPAIRAAADRVQARLGWRPDRAIINDRTLLEISGLAPVCNKTYVGFVGRIYIRCDKRVPEGCAWMNRISASEDDGGEYPGPTEVL